MEEDVIHNIMKAKVGIPLRFDDGFFHHKYQDPDAGSSYLISLRCPLYFMLPTPLEEWIPLQINLRKSFTESTTDPNTETLSSFFSSAFEQFVGPDMPFAIIIACSDNFGNTRVCGFRDRLGRCSLAVRLRPNDVNGKTGAAPGEFLGSNAHTRIEEIGGLGDPKTEASTIELAFELPQTAAPGGWMDLTPVGHLLELCLVPSSNGSTRGSAKAVNALKFIPLCETLFPLRWRIQTGTNEDGDLQNAAATREGGCGFVAGGGREGGDKDSLTVLWALLKKQFACMQHIDLAFSGGLDSCLLANAALERHCEEVVLLNYHHAISSQGPSTGGKDSKSTKGMEGVEGAPVSLLCTNVSFDGVGCPDRKHGLASFASLALLYEPWLEHSRDKGNMPNGVRFGLCINDFSKDQVGELRKKTNSQLLGEQILSPIHQSVGLALFGAASTIIGGERCIYVRTWQDALFLLGIDEEKIGKLEALSSFVDEECQRRMRYLGSKGFNDPVESLRFHLSLRRDSQLAPALYEILMDQLQPFKDDIFCTGKAKAVRQSVIAKLPSNTEPQGGLQGGIQGGLQGGIQGGLQGGPPRGPPKLLLGPPSGSEQSGSKQVDSDILPGTKCPECSKYKASNKCANGVCASCCKKKQRNSESDNKNHDQSSTDQPSTDQPSADSADQTSVGSPNMGKMCPKHSPDHFYALRAQREAAKATMHEIMRHRHESFQASHKEVGPKAGFGRGMESDAYKSERILVLGSGADELFGGYARFKSRELFGGLEAWRNELIADCERIPERNLGRDDRLFLTAGRSAVVCPFLADDVITFAARLSNHHLRHGDLLRLSPPHGDAWDENSPQNTATRADLEREFRVFIDSDTKLVLRELAIALCQYPAAVFRKKAAQFGTGSREWEQS